MPQAVTYHQSHHDKRSKVSNQNDGETDRRTLAQRGSGLGSSRRVFARVDVGATGKDQGRRSLQRHARSFLRDAAKAAAMKLRNRAKAAGKFIWQFVTGTSIRKFRHGCKNLDQAIHEASARHSGKSG